jgi:hypothetical protein
MTGVGSGVCCASQRLRVNVAAAFVDEPMAALTTDG